MATTIVAAREALGWSVRDLAKAAGLNQAGVWRIEQGRILSPKAESLQAIADALSIPVSDLFAIAGWVPKKELPTLRPYLRTKYGALPPEAAAEIEIHFDQLARKHGISFDPSNGPVDGEDE